jgi:hypothetical protein
MNDKTRPPVPPVRLVSETSAETINAQRQQQEIVGRAFACALLDLTANAPRVAAGAGKPYELIKQIIALRETAEAWAQARVQSDLPIRGRWSFPRRGAARSRLAVRRPRLFHASVGRRKRRAAIALIFGTGTARLRPATGRSHCFIYPILSDSRLTLRYTHFAI